MRVPFSKRSADDELAAVARLRVAQLAGSPPRGRRSHESQQPFGGWVPQVPDRARHVLLDDASRLDERPEPGSTDDGADIGADVATARSGAAPDANPDYPGAPLAATETARTVSPTAGHTKGVQLEDGYPRGPYEDDGYASVGTDGSADGARPDDSTADGVVPDVGTAGGRDTQQHMTAGAVADRLPMSVRSVWERWAPGLKLELGRGQVAVVVFVLLVGVAVAALVYTVGRPQTTPVASEVVASGTSAPPGLDQHSGAAPAGAGADGAGAPHGQDSAEPADQSGGGRVGGTIVIHVAGKVDEPGVVTLPPGSRVVDAIDAAGGADADVDLTPLNLARVLGDGEQVLVGVEPPPGHESSAGNATEGGPGARDGDVGTDATVVNLNTASSQQLETLPGIGPTLAQRIVQWREQNGQFSSIDELHEVSGIGPSKFADIAPLVTV